jgi:hypothetical protein
MGSDIDLEAGQAAQATPLEVLTVREEEVGAVETHEMDILGPHTSRVASSLQSVPTGQDIKESQSVVSQAEGATSICACCLIQR